MITGLALSDGKDKLTFDGKGFGQQQGEQVDLVQAGVRSNHQAMIGERLGWLWQKLSIRGQILATFFLVTLVAGVIAAGIVVYNAQRAAEVEIAASMELAERFVREAIERPGWDNSGTTLLRHLSLQLSNLRHVRILVTDTYEGWVSMMPSEAGGASADGPAGVPKWFTALVQVNDVRREMKIGSNGRYIGSVSLVGHAADEIAEVWHDTRDLAIVAIVLNLAVIGILYLALGRVLHPLTRLANGLNELEHGQFRHRLSRPKVRELASIADRFNALADRLGAVKADNERLTRRLITGQDDDRRQIAAELHDELGPCLFGVKANVASLDQLAADLPAAVAGSMRERTAAIAEIADKIQTLNRRLLTKLRPMALGHVSLANVIASLVADFEQHDAAPRFSVTIGHLAHGYGDSVDLTVYRCLQEAITNAVRHAEARTIAIGLDERPTGIQQGWGSEALSVLLLSVRDDGQGIAPGTPYGLGLTSMEERVHALGGSFTIASWPSEGTYIEIAIPLEKALGPTLHPRRVRGSKS